MRAARAGGVGVAERDWRYVRARGWGRVTVVEKERVVRMDCSVVKRVARRVRYVPSVTKWAWGVEVAREMAEGLMSGSGEVEGEVRRA